MIVRCVANMAYTLQRMYANFLKRGETIMTIPMIVSALIAGIVCLGLGILLGILFSLDASVFD